MLKKSKNTKYPPPPTPPTVAQILEDLETFHVELNAVPRREQTSAAADGRADWWTRFEKAVTDQERLKLLISDISNCKEKLESTKLELEAEAQSLKAAIQEQQAKIEDVLANESV